MTREQARMNLEALGFTDVTKEQIDNYLNQLQGETNKYSATLDNAKKNAELVTSLQAKIDELESQNMTEIEKANKERDKSIELVSTLEAKIKAMELKTSLAEKGIVGDNADKLIASLGSGTLDVELLGQIITDREVASAKAKELEIANGSQNPGGDKGSDDEGKSADVLMAEAMKGMFGERADEDNQNYYVLK